MSKPRVGLIGIGAMGRGVAANLLAKGFDVSGLDVRPEAGEWLLEQGGQVAADLPSLAGDCRTIISFVVNDAQTEDVLFGDKGLVGCMQPGTVFVACSTMPVDYVSRLGDRLAALGIHLLDAPVTGGAAGAAKGSLTIMAAGERAVFDAVHPVLQTFGGRIFFVGDKPGAGAQLKVLNQHLCGVHLAAAGEALALAQRQGLPLDIALEVLSSGSAFSWMLGDRGPRMAREDFGQVTSAVNIFVKDLGLVLDTARQAGFAAPLASAAFNAFVSVSGQGMGAWDDSAVMCFYDRHPGTAELPKPPPKTT